MVAIFKGVLSLTHLIVSKKAGEKLNFVGKWSRAKVKRLVVGNA